MKQKTVNKRSQKPALLKNPWTYLVGSIILLTIVLGLSYLQFLRVVDEQEKAYTVARSNLQELKTTLEKVDPESPWDFDAYCDYVNLGFGGRGQRSCQTHLILDKVFINPDTMRQQYITALENRKDLIEKRSEPYRHEPTSDKIVQLLAYDYSFKLPNGAVGCRTSSRIYNDNKLNIQIVCSGNALREYYPCKEELTELCDSGDWDGTNIGDGWIQISW